MAALSGPSPSTASLLSGTGSFPRADGDRFVIRQRDRISGNNAGTIVAMAGCVRLFNGPGSAFGFTSVYCRFYGSTKLHAWRGNGGKKASPQ
jgi:hypothetical protein